MNSAVRALVVGHAGFSAGIVSAVEQITGNGASLMPLSNDGQGSTGIEALLRLALANTGARVVFTDLPAGSAAMAVRRIQKDMPGLTVVAGANLAVLLEFVQSAADGPDARAALMALEKGRAAMIECGVPRVD